MTKRVFDFTASLAGLLLLSPLLVAIAVVIRLSSRGPVFFRQERVGRNFKPFRIYKFRTMVVDAPKIGASITVARDPRITRVGHFLRKSKLDELPQLINVLLGDMSIVGPRPEVPKYVELFRDQYERILAFRPGITDLASIEYRDENDVLASASDPETAYIQEVLPAKLALSQEYCRRASLAFDLYLIGMTVFKLLPGQRRGAS